MTPRSRHRGSRPRPARPLRRRRWVLVGVASVAVMTALWLPSVTALESRPSASAQVCPGGNQSLLIVAAPEIAPVVSAVVRMTTTGTSEPGDRPVKGDTVASHGSCLVPVVRSERPAATARSLLTNPGDRPDVWIPDSSAWTRQRGALGSLVSGAPASIASSPYVLAVPTRAAVSLSAHSDPPRVADLLPRGGESTTPVRWAFPTPGRSLATQAALVALRTSVANRPDEARVLTSVVRTGDNTVPTDLAAALAATRSVPTAVPATEQQAVAYDSSQLATPLRIVYEGPSAGAADYPFVVLAASRAHRLAAEELLEAIRSDPGRRLLQARGFRDHTGVPGGTLTSHPDVDRRTLRYRAPDPKVTRAALRAHRAIGRSSRLLAVVDVSGSMAAAVPGGAGATRLDLALQALTAGLAVYDDDNVAGLWTFSTSLSPRSDHRQLVPPVRLGTGQDGSSGRARLVRALADVSVKPYGGTGLYDTALAAVRTLQRHWDPHRANSVVLITDGANEDPHGFDLRTTLSLLASERDPARPVAVFAVAYGPSADLSALQRITAVTGGAAYPARDPRDIGSVIADAIGRRGSSTR